MNQKSLAFVLVLLGSASACSKADSSKETSKKAGDQELPSKAQPTAQMAEDKVAVVPSTKNTAKSAPEAGVFAPLPLSEEQAKAIYQSPIKTIVGKESKLGDFAGKAILAVNVASECGLTPQYEDLQALHEQYADKGLAVVGFPCNQFGGQEPGSHEEIAAFGKEKFGVDFALMEKVEVNGEKQHPIYSALTKVVDKEGKAGDVKWNFEKFLLSADGKSVTRIRPQTSPRDAAVVKAIEAALPKS